MPFTLSKVWFLRVVADRVASRSSRARPVLVFARSDPFGERRVPGAFYSNKCEGTRPVDGSPLPDVDPRRPLAGGAGLEMKATLYDHAAAAADEPVAWVAVMIALAGAVGVMVVRRRLAR